MNTNKLADLKSELNELRNEAVAATIAGDTSRADCLTGKAVGMKTTMQVAERLIANKSDSGAAGELEGMERVLNALAPVPRC